MEEKDKKEDLLEAGMDIIDQAPEQAIDASQESVEVPQEEIPQLSKEENLLQELNAIREESNKQIEEARSDDNTSRLIAQLGPALAQYVTGGMQASSGANINTPQFKGIDPSMFDSSSNLINKKKEDLEAKLQEFRMLNPKKDIRTLGNRVVEISPDGEVETLLDAPGMSKKDEAQLQLKNRELDIKERLAEQKRTLDQLKLQQQQVKTEKAQQEKDMPKLTKAQEKVDVEFAKDYNEFVNRGGFADVNKNLDQLDEAIVALENSDKMTGPIVGSVPKFARDIINPKSASIQEAVEEVVQRNLRLVLGAQFTEKEGERLISRAYNPRLSEEENIKRLKRLSKQIKGAADAKQRAGRHYEEKGTLKDFKGLVPQSADDFLKDVKPTKEEKPSQDDKIVVRKDGKSFRLPKRQLEQALSQGYELVE